jgi:DNA-binding response OmpR family regulator
VPATHRTALVVDDEEVIRRLVRTVLEADDFAVLEAGDGSEALEVAAREQPAVVILDVMMPDMDGVEVCKQLDHNIVKVVMLTARDDAELEKKCRDAGAVAFLTKPFSSIELLDLIEELTA